MWFRVGEFDDLLQFISALLCSAPVHCSGVAVGLAPTTFTDTLKSENCSTADADIHVCVPLFVSILLRAHLVSNCHSGHGNVPVASMLWTCKIAHISPWSAGLRDISEPTTQ